MEVTRAYRFRIYPDAKRQSEIDYQITLAQSIYNASWNMYVIL
jgi:putative transposase